MSPMRPNFHTALMEDTCAMYIIAQLCTQLENCMRPLSRGGIFIGKKYRLTHKYRLRIKNPRELIAEFIKILKTILQDGNLTLHNIHQYYNSSGYLFLVINKLKLNYVCTRADMEVPYLDIPHLHFFLEKKRLITRTLIANLLSVLRVYILFLYKESNTINKFDEEILRSCLSCLKAYFKQEDYIIRMGPKWCKEFMDNVLSEIFSSETTKNGQGIYLPQQITFSIDTDFSATRWIQYYEYIDMPNEFDFIAKHYEIVSLVNIFVRSGRESPEGSVKELEKDNFGLIDRMSFENFIHDISREMRQVYQDRIGMASYDFDEDSDYDFDEDSDYDFDEDSDNQENTDSSSKDDENTSSSSKDE